MVVADYQLFTIIDERPWKKNIHKNNSHENTPSFQKVKLENFYHAFCLIGSRLSEDNF